MMLSPVILLGLLGLMVYFGVRDGLFRSLFALAGLFLGMILGGALALKLMVNYPERPGLILIAMSCTILLGAVLGHLATFIVSGVELKIKESRFSVVNSVAGGILMVVVGSMAILTVAETTTFHRADTAAHQEFEQDFFIQTMQTITPFRHNITQWLGQNNSLAMFEGQRIITDPIDDNIQNDLDIIDASNHVYKIEGTGCGYLASGSGFAWKKDRIITNAHVVAGSTDLEVIKSTGEKLSARIIFYDPVNDIAVLGPDDDSEWDLTPLKLATNAPQDTSGAVVGYPKGGPLKIAPARLAGSRLIITKDIYNMKAIPRHVTAFRGEIQQGNSGGVIINDKGEVLTLIFGSNFAANIEKGGYGISLKLLKGVLAKVPNSDKAVEQTDCQL